MGDPSGCEANLGYFAMHVQIFGWEMVSKKQSNITEYSRISLV